MIYIWDNGECYSNHAIYLIESDLPWTEIEPIVGLREYTAHTDGELLASAESVSWFEGAPATLGSIVDVEAFFDEPRDPAPDPGAKRLYEGWHADPNDSIAANRRAWSIGKYKFDDESRVGSHYVGAVNPVDENFSVLTSASARELIDGWTKDYQRPYVEAFKAECRSRGLL